MVNPDASRHREYTIDGETYYAVGSTLYTALDEQHGIEQIDEHAIHLYQGRPARLEWGGDIFSAVTVSPPHSPQTTIDTVRKGDFDTAIPLERVRPDGVQKCPECGSWAGPVEEEPMCVECGHGLETPESA